MSDRDLKRTLSKYKSFRISAVKKDEENLSSEEIESKISSFRKSSDDYQDFDASFHDLEPSKTVEMPKVSLSTRNDRKQFLLNTLKSHSITASRFSHISDQYLDELATLFVKFEKDNTLRMNLWKLTEALQALKINNFTDNKLYELVEEFEKQTEKQMENGEYSTFDLLLYKQKVRLENGNLLTNSSTKLSANPKNDENAFSIAANKEKKQTNSKITVKKSTGAMNLNLKNVRKEISSLHKTSANESPSKGIAQLSPSEINSDLSLLRDTIDFSQFLTIVSHCKKFDELVYDDDALSAFGSLFI